VGCLVFIALAALTLVAVLVLGPVFAVSDFIKWLLGGGAAKLLLTVLPWVALVAVVVLAPFALLVLQDEKKWKQLHKPGNEEKKKQYWASLNQPDQNLNKENYLKWLHQPENAEKLQEYEGRERG
jgi:hypothetical protein